MVFTACLEPTSDLSDGQLAGRAPNGLRPSSSPRRYYNRGGFSLTDVALERPTSVYCDPGSKYRPRVVFSDVCIGRQTDREQYSTPEYVYRSLTLS